MISRLCIFGIGVSVFALILVMSVMSGFHRNIKQKLLAVEPHLVVTNLKGLQDQVVAEISKEPGAEYHSFEQQDVILRTVDGLFGGAVANGLESPAMEQFLKRAEKFSNHRKSSMEDDLDLSALAPGEVLMGVDLAHSLGVLSGDEVVVVPPESLLLPAGEVPEYARVRVKKLLSTELSDIDSQMIYYGLGQTFQRFGNTASRQTGIMVRLKHSENFKPLQGRLQKLGVTVESWVDRNSTLFFALTLEKYAIATFLGLSALITSFSIITVLVLLVTHKRGDIGMLKAMGLSRRKTRRVFAGIGLLLSAIGLGGGLLLGVAVASFLKAYPLNILPDIYYDSSIPAEVDVATLIVATIGAILVAVAAAWIPSRIAAQESVVDGLRAD